MSRPKRFDHMLARHGLGAGSIGTREIDGATYAVVAERTPDDFEDAGRFATANVMRDQGLLKTVYLHGDDDRLYAAVEDDDGVRRMVKLTG